MKLTGECAVNVGWISSEVFSLIIFWDAKFNGIFFEDEILTKFFHWNTLEIYFNHFNCKISWKREHDWKLDGIIKS